MTVDLRVEAPDGRSAVRELRRSLLADGVRPRRWRDGVAATMLRPAGDATATLLIDATTDQEPTGVAGALLASRGVLVLTVTEALDLARERLALIPGAGKDVLVLPAAHVPPPPGVPARGAGDRGPAWDALLVALEAQPR